MKPNRRNFLKSSALAAGATIAFGGTKVRGANDTIRVAVCGIHGRGGSHIDEFQKMDNVEVVCLVDPDSRTFERRVKQVESLGGKTPKTYQDIRQALEKEQLDVLSIASTNHWHALQAIWGCEAGCHVYVEKPCSHNIHEGRILVETARKYNRLVQHGTQGRSSSHWWRLAEIIKQGTYGKLLASRGLCYKRRTSIGFEPLTLSYPEELSYDLWLGPAQEQAFSSNLVHYNWHWFWEFGNGDIGNQGVHQMDVARWMIPGATLPESVISVGGRFGYVDQGETANTQISIMDFGKDRPQLIFEVRGLETDDYLGEKVGNILHFEEGYVSSGRFHPKNGASPENLPDVEIDIGPGRGHFDNFIAAVQSGKQSDLNAEILEGHYSSACCHLANVSYQVGREWPMEKVPEAFQSNDFALDAFERMKEHLVKNEVELSETNYKIGRKLKVDKVSERFIDDPRADALATRTYRAPFVVPEKVV